MDDDDEEYEEDEEEKNTHRNLYFHFFLSIESIVIIVIITHTSNVRICFGRWMSIHTKRNHICNKYFSMLAAQIWQHKPGICHLAIEMSQHFKSNEISNNQLSIAICMNPLIKSINNNFLSTTQIRETFFIGLRKANNQEKLSLAIKKPITWDRWK